IILPCSALPIERCHFDARGPPARVRHSTCAMSTPEGGRMRAPRSSAFAASVVLAAVAGACTTTRSVGDEYKGERPTSGEPLKPEAPRRVVTGIAPREFPRIPDPDPAAAWVPDGYRVELVM